MTALSGLQERFQDYVLSEDAPLQGTASPLADIAPPPRGTAEGRLAIYHNAYRARLLECLEHDYPALKALAGDELFERLGRDYIAAHPSTYRNIRWYGDRLPEFLCNIEHRQARLLADMAALEWAMTLAFDGDEASPIDDSAVARIPPADWPAMSFSAVPSLQQISLCWNVTTFWKAVTEAREPRPPEPYAQPVSVALWRRGLSVHYQSLQEEEVEALTRMAAGAPFALICEAVAQHVGEEQAPLRAAQLLKHWLAQEMISAVHSTV